MEPSENPAWPTTLRSRLRDGRMMGTDGSVWVYRSVPMSPVVDARSPQDGLNAAEPLLAAYDELASMTSISVSRRAMAKSNYRETHALLVNVPKFFEPDRTHPLAEYLRQNFSRVPTDRRILLFGVRLKDQVGGSGGLRATVDSVVETLVGGGTPLSDFDADFERVSAAMDRAGLAPASNDDISLANAWWNHGDFPDTPMLVHGDHLHFFNSAEAVQVADRVGVDECHLWEDKGVPGHHAITFASVQDLEIPFLDTADPRSNWVSDMISSGALVVSVRGQVEPSKVTRDELRRQRKRFIDDINERAKSGKMERAEQEEMLHTLSQVEGLYSRGGVPPTLAGASIVVGLDGMTGDINQVLPSSSVAKLAVMNYRQPGAMGETMLCSNMRANPNLHDLPTQVIACSGMPSLNLVGDSDGAAVGFTERDRQIALLSPTAASVADTLPLLLGAGATGSGKTQLALHLLTQYAKMGRPGIFIDPKALTLDTPIPTPDGWTTMGEVEVGQQVFDRHGKPCNVTHKSRIFTADETRLYEVVLDDGQVIRADQNHLWVVLDQKARKRMAADGALTDDVYIREMLTEDLIAEGVKVGRQTNFAIPVAGAAQFPEADLAIDPYLFGVWLGDGKKTSGEIASSEVDLVDMQANIDAVWPLSHVYRDGDKCPVIVLDRDFERCLYGHDDYVMVNRGERGEVKRCNSCEAEHQAAYRVGEKRVSGDMTNPSFTHLLRQVDVHGDKHIPATYLTSSYDQRFALLQGLMDTDGTVKKRGDLRITMTNERLMRDVLALVRSLGFKATFWEGPAVISQDGVRREVGREYVVTFRTTRSVFRLPRKQEMQTERTTESPRSKHLYIKEIRPVVSEQAQCIRVDSPDHTYLVHEFVPTHNTGSDHSPIVLAAGGQVASLDELTAADGIFDPIRFSATKEVGVELAASLLMSVNPWGHLKDDMEVPLQHALSYGVQQGATCIGEALAAAKVGIPGLPPLLIQRVEELAGSSPMFRACVGVRPGTTGLRVAEGITLIKVGNSHLDLPEPGQPPSSISQRIALALVRMMVFGSAMALTGRKGVVMLDEAWVFLGAGRSEVERLGRLARSQQVLPMLWTQRVSDAVNAGLSGYISRGLILPIEDPDEAAAACQLFKLEPTPERISRITAKAMVGGSSTEGTALNWNSMRALRDPKTGVVKRGSIVIYADLAGRAIPCEVVLPKEFLDLSSTNPEDIARREEKAAAERASRAYAAQAALTDPGPDAGGAPLDNLF